MEKINDGEEMKKKHLWNISYQLNMKKSPHLF